MQKTRAPDPRRRMPLSEWPEIDRALWDAALRPADLLDDGGSRARHAPSSNQKAVKGYGKWLAWLAERDLLDPHSRPGSRITPERVRAYLETLRQGVSTGTLINLLEDLYAVARVMDPDGNWSWIWPLVSQIRARHVPVRRKQDRIVSANELLDLGFDLMRRSSSARTAIKRAVHYRDGLMIAFLSTRPLRLRNLAGLDLGRTFVSRGDTWWIDIPGEETKTKEPIEMPLPDELTPAFDGYLNVHRPILCRQKNRWTAPIGSALWVSTNGSPMRVRSIPQRIVDQTRAAFGHSVNPHLFRDCVATSIAIDDPDHVRIAARLLGHRSLATTDKYYNQARSIDAVRRYQELVAGVRDGTIELSRDREDDP
jgi:integrase/recombinase XerD